jgi:hypothetical protein
MVYFEFVSFGRFLEFWKSQLGWGPLIRVLVSGSACWPLDSGRYYFSHAHGFTSPPLMRVVSLIHVAALLLPPYPHATQTAKQGVISLLTQTDTALLCSCTPALPTMAPLLQ